MDSLTAPDGSLVTEHQDLTQVACNFYEDLFGQKNTIDSSQTILLNSITTPISDSMNTAMNMDISTDEILTAIACCGNNKMPGPDGFTAEFYKAFSTEIAPILTIIYNKCQYDIPKSMKDAGSSVSSSKRETRPNSKIGDPSHYSMWITKF